MPQRRGFGSLPKLDQKARKLLEDDPHNLGAHRPKRVRELIEEKDCELPYLPSYSPDLNPIEEAFAKIKNLLHKVSARTKEALVEAIGVALAAITAEDVRGFFEYAGYWRNSVQLL